MEDAKQLPGLALLPERLLPWFSENARELPWRRDRLPYHVWLSEIMLQQTRVEAVKGYYTRFLDALPTIEALANTDETQYLKLWEGLGYYSRVRNLHKAACVIMQEYNGVFPSDYDSVRSLPGIGDYTAGAIMSICFDRPHPAVDGNVLRVISRYCDDHSCTDDASVKKQYRDHLAAIYPPEAGTFTQALMELGATVCVPNGAPLCEICPLKDCCLAMKKGTIDELPVRAEKRKRRIEEKTVFLLTCEDRTAICRRDSSGLLAGLWEFPNMPGLLSEDEVIQTAEAWNLHPQAFLKQVGRKHIFTHIEWHMNGIRLECAAPDSRFIWASREELKTIYALPTAFRQFVQDIWEEEP